MSEPIACHNCGSKNVAYEELLEEFGAGCLLSVLEEKDFPCITCRFCDYVDRDPIRLEKFREEWKRQIIEDA